VINAGDHFNNGALTAAVLPCQTVNFAFFKRQIHVIQRQHARELLADILKSDKCGGVGHRQYPCDAPRRWVRAFCFGSLGPIGAGQAVQKKRAKEKVAVVGIAMPAQAAPYLMRGDIKKALLWDPKDAGYALVTVADQLLKGKEVTSDLTIDGLGKADVDMEKKVIRFNKILEVTKDNAQSLGF